MIEAECAWNANKNMLVSQEGQKEVPKRIIMAPYSTPHVLVFLGENFENNNYKVTIVVFTDVAGTCEDLY